MRALRRTSEQSHAVNWDAVSDPDGGLDLSQVKSLVSSNAELRYVEMMFESRLMAITDETSRLKGMDGRAMANDKVFTLLAHVPQEVDRLGQILDGWTDGLLEAANDLESRLLLWLSPDRELRHFYIGSSDDEIGDAGGESSRHDAVSAFPFDFDYEDLVCLTDDFVTSDDRVIRQGTLGRVRAVYRYDEMPMIEVQFPGEFICHGVSDHDLRLVEKAEALDDVRFMSDTND